MKTTIASSLFVLLAWGPAAAAQEKPCKPMARAVEKRICAGEIGGSARELRDMMWKPLFEQYAKEKGLLPTEDELRSMSALFDKVREPGMERTDLEANFIRSLVLNWKVGRDLHRQHGGRVALSSLGFHQPIDAMAVFFKEQERQGALEIHDPELRETFWQELKAGTWGDGMVAGEEARRIFATPIWEQSTP